MSILKMRISSECLPELHQSTKCNLQCWNCEGFSVSVNELDETSKRCNLVDYSGTRLDPEHIIGDLLPNLLQSFTHYTRNMMKAHTIITISVVNYVF